MDEKRRVPLVFHCGLDNDRYRVLADLGLALPRYESLPAARPGPGAR